MVPFNLALVVTSLVVISIHAKAKSFYSVFQRTRLLFFKAQIKNLCLTQGPKIAGVVLHRVGIFGFFCPKQGQGLRPSAAHLSPNIGRVPPRARHPPHPSSHTHNCQFKFFFKVSGGL